MAVAAGSALVVVLVVVVAPRYLLEWDADGAVVVDRPKAINDIRNTLLQGLAGMALLVGAFFTWRQVQVSRQGNITTRFTAVVEQLGSANVEVRIGAVYALERVAQESRADRSAIVELLCSYVQRNALAIPRDDRPVPADIEHKSRLAQEHGGAVPLAIRAPEIQAAVRVLGRSPRQAGQVLGLSRVDLRRAWLAYSDFADADLHYADLTDALFLAANLRGADLTGIWLAGASLIGADLGQADLRTAVLWNARLDQADLRSTDLTGADLTRAVVDGARFELADLRGADFTETNLTAATLTGAVADATTTWPRDFDPVAAGVLPGEAAPPIRPQSYYIRNPVA